MKLPKKNLLIAAAICSVMIGLGVTAEARARAAAPTPTTLDRAGDLPPVIFIGPRPDRRSPDVPIP